MDEVAVVSLLLFSSSFFLLLPFFTSFLLPNFFLLPFLPCSFYFFCFLSLFLLPVSSCIYSLCPFFLLPSSSPLVLPLFLFLIPSSVQFFFYFSWFAGCRSTAHQEEGRPRMEQAQEWILMNDCLPLSSSSPHSASLLLLPPLYSSISILSLVDCRHISTQRCARRGHATRPCPPSVAAARSAHHTIIVPLSVLAVVGAYL